MGSKGRKWPGREIAALGLGGWRGGFCEDEGCREVGWGRELRFALCGFDEVLLLEVLFVLV